MLRPLAVVLGALLCAHAAPPAKLHNILLIVADDLRPNIGAYGASFMHTPNLDELAASGTLFEHTFVQYSFCAPSRNSFMTGRRPDQTRSYNFIDHFREAGVGANWTALPQYFRQHGYRVLGAGKLFHPGLPPNFDAPRSWDEFVWTGGAKVVGCNDTVNGNPVWDGLTPGVRCQTGAGGLGADGCSNESGAIVVQDGFRLDAPNWCAVDRDRLRSPLVDDLTLEAAMSFLDVLAATASAKRRSAQPPWFLAVGWHKPHTPWNCPAEFFDRYDPAALAMPRREVLPAGAFPGGWHPAPFNESWRSPTPTPYVRQLRRAYYACVSYVDSLTGALLRKLDETGMRNDTAVLFTSDREGRQRGTAAPTLLAPLLGQSLTRPSHHLFIAHPRADGWQLGGAMRCAACNETDALPLGSHTARSPALPHACSPTQARMLTILPCQS